MNILIWVNPLFVIIGVFVGWYLRGKCKTTSIEKKSENQEFDIYIPNDNEEYERERIKEVLK